jgi:hypothetical protein
MGNNVFLENGVYTSHTILEGRYLIVPYQVHMNALLMF